METLIVIAAALIVIVLLDASYHDALCLIRWTPCFVLGLLVGWLALRHGVEALAALLLGALTCVMARRVP